MASVETNIEYVNALHAQQIKKEFEDECKENGYRVGVDFKTMKPIYWVPALPEGSSVMPRHFVEQFRGRFIYRNIGEFDDILDTRSNADTCERIVFV